MRLRASCGGEEITPIHLFVLEHALPGKDRDVIREGLHIFVLGDMVGCAELTLSLFSEKAPDKADTNRHRAGRARADPQGRHPGRWCRPVAASPSSFVQYPRLPAPTGRARRSRS